MIEMVDKVRERKMKVKEYSVDIYYKSMGEERIVDIYVEKVEEMKGEVVIILKEKRMEEKIERKMKNRGEES